MESDRATGYNKFEMSMKPKENYVFTNHSYWCFYIWWVKDIWCLHERLIHLQRDKSESTMSDVFKCFWMS